MKEIIENIKENADELKSKEVLNEVEYSARSEPLCPLERATYSAW